jgi:hypothetical protein
LDYLRKLFHLLRPSKIGISTSNNDSNLEADPLGVSEGSSWSSSTRV